MLFDCSILGWRGLVSSERGSGSFCSFWPRMNWRRSRDLPDGRFWRGSLSWELSLTIGDLLSSLGFGLGDGGFVLTARMSILTIGSGSVKGCLVSACFGEDLDERFGVISLLDSSSTICWMLSIFLTLFLSSEICSKIDSSLIWFCFSEIFSFVSKSSNFC